MFGCAPPPAASPAKRRVSNASIPRLLKCESGTTARELISRALEVLQHNQARSGHRRPLPKSGGSSWSQVTSSIRMG